MKQWQTDRHTHIHSLRRNSLDSMIFRTHKIRKCFAQCHRHTHTNCSSSIFISFRRFFRWSFSSLDKSENILYEMRLQFSRLRCGCCWTDCVCSMFAVCRSCWDRKWKNFCCFCCNSFLSLTLTLPLPLTQFLYFSRILFFETFFSAFLSDVVSVKLVAQVSPLKRLTNGKIKIVCGISYIDTNETNETNERNISLSLAVVHSLLFVCFTHSGDGGDDTFDSSQSLTTGDDTLTENCWMCEWVSEWVYVHREVFYIFVSLYWPCNSSVYI